ncbi:MAG: hypothetical protein H0Z24_03235 [Thermosipho sp. (in: Bacteria)]|nr:hypothetical protein [Thermosipho sp. (in: thermotogales)]
MNLEYFKNKTYEIPADIPQKHKAKYLEVIDAGYAKYIDILYRFGYMFNQQFVYILQAINDNKWKFSSAKVIGGRIVNRLEELGFIGTDYINRNKLLYIRRPGMALATGSYKNPRGINLSKDLKNNKVMVSLLKVEYFIRHKKILNHYTAIQQLKDITREIIKTAMATGNRWGYAVETAQELLEINQFVDAWNLLDSRPEYQYRLGIIRTLWNEVGNEFRKLILHRQTISDKPEYLRLFVSEDDGQIFLHYIPNIIIFDSHDLRYYRDKMNKLFHGFYKISGNELRNIQSQYLKSNKTGMGYRWQHHIGYKITLVGADEEVLREKARVVNEEIGSSASSPLMDYCAVEVFPVGKYLNRPSRKHNSISKAEEERLDKNIIERIAQIRDKDKGNALGREVLDLIR